MEVLKEEIKSRNEDDQRHGLLPGSSARPLPENVDVDMDAEQLQQEIKLVNDRMYYHKRVSITSVFTPLCVLTPVGLLQLHHIRRATSTRYHQSFYRALQHNAARLHSS